MTTLLRTVPKALCLSALLATTAPPALAQTVLRLDEVAVGELDPGKASDYADSILMFNVYDTLVLPAQGAPGHVPHLASGWTIEGNTITFTLRDDVTFQSGNPLTAADVVWSLDRMKALGQGLSFLFGVVDRAEALDDHTVRFTLTEPYAPFIAALVRLPIIDSALVAANIPADGSDPWGEAYLSAHAAGTGAYAVQSHNPQEETVMVKNPGYFLGIAEGAPDVVRLRYGLEAATVRALIAQGEHDISSQWLPPEVMAALGAEGAQFFQESGTGAFYIKLNTRKPPLDDVNCRLALASAFDYATAVSITQIAPGVAGAVPATGAVPVGMFGAKPREEGVLARDMDAARAHLANCAYDPANYTLELSWIAEVPLEERFALLMQSNFAELGFRTEIVRVPWVLFTERVTSPENTPHVSQVFVTAVTGDPDTLLYPMYHSSAAGTWQSPEYLSDPEVDRLLEAGRTAATAAEREAAYSALNDRLLALAPSIYGFDRNSVFAASPRVSAPALTDPAQAFALDGMGFSFRLMTVTD
jgi:peptide/nickel transport system substrate-binding protein